MGKNKLLHFEENKTFPNFFQPDFSAIKNGFRHRGIWCKEVFRNPNPLVLELGCGKGEYTIGLAQKYPAMNFIGIDKKGARMWRGGKTAQLEQISNVAFLRLKIEQIVFCFKEHEVNEIWITFPDPVPKKRRENRRLTSPKFLSLYKTVLCKGGTVHLKTDDQLFFEYTLDSLASFKGKPKYQTDDLYRSGFTGDAAMIQTYYESKFLQEGIPIKYLQFSL